MGRLHSGEYEERNGRLLYARSGCGWNMKNWRYTHPYDPMLLSMHDCIVTRIEVEESEDETRMVWYLPDGIWIAPEIPCHEIQEICRTADAQLAFVAKHPDFEWDASAAICMKSRWHGKDKRMNTETWEHMTLGEFVTKMKNSGWSLEIIRAYTEGQLFYITGEIHTPTERYFAPFRLDFVAEKATYFWDDIHIDRVW